MPDMSITGIASGIDWDSMVTKLLESAKKPALVMLDKRDRLEQKKSLWEELRVSMQALQASLPSLKLSSTFKAKQVEIERIDRNTSYKGVLSATVTADAAIAVHDLEVLQLARGQENSSKTFSSSSNLSSIFTGSTTSSYFYVNAGGHKVRIDVAKTDTLTSLAEKINLKLKTQVPPLGVTASVVTQGNNEQLVLKSDNVGLGQISHTATITRSVNAYDTVAFSLNPNNTDPNVEPPTFTLDMELGGVNGGTVTIKGENGTVYTAGVDFDIVSGNRIRWRTHDPLVPPPGAVYYDEYTAYAGDTYEVTATRSSGGNVDTGVLPFAPRSGATVTINDGVNTYSAGSDFAFAPDGSIHWLKDFYKPADGASYTVTYVAVGGEKVTLEITRSNQDVLSSSSYSNFVGGTTTIQQSGSRIWREGFDFDIVQGSTGEAVVQWYTGGAGDAPVPDPIPMTPYTVTLQKTDGTSATYSGTRNAKDTVGLPNGGTFTSAPQGSHTITYNGVSFSVDSPPAPPTSGDLTADLDSTKKNLEITWATPTGTPSARSGAPAYGNTANDTYTVTYTYNSSTFYLSDDGNGILGYLGLGPDTGYTAAQDAEMILNGDKVTRSSNHIGEAYKNELIKGMTIELKGLGRVSMDVSQDAEKAVTAMQTFLTAYNDILSWINTRMTEKEVDASKKATLDSDDFRMKWGLLRGNSLLRDTKNTMRRLTSQTYATGFDARASRNAIYGPMSQNSIVNPGSFTLKAGNLTATIPVRPEDTLEDIANRINSPKIDGTDNPLYVVTGKTVTQYAKASVKDNKLVLQGGVQDQKIVLGGSSHVLSSLGLSYEYNALSQIGLKFASQGEMSPQGQTGELDFDSSVFMTALENNAEDVSMLVTNFAATMQTFVDNTIKASSKEIAIGVTTAQGSVMREMNAIDEEIKSIDKYLANFEKRLLAKQENLYKQFSAAEVNLSKMMQQASWLSSVTAQLQQQSAGQQ
ncbi:MAG: flagellar filament capping protein FliD [Synergistaceae bacterium]|jgi:flagellar capping protein FliD|nr:flagellar filament capping protein FliD [Synergistaceae bacterium]